MKRFLTSFAVLAMAAGSARSEVLFTDDFSYSDGNLVTVGSANWTVTTGTERNQLQVVSNKLIINDDLAGVGGIYNLYRPLPHSISSGTIYASFTLKVSAADIPSAGVTGATANTAGPYFDGFAQATASPTNAGSKVLLSRSSPVGNYKIGITRGGGAVAPNPGQVVNAAPDFIPGTEYLIVHSYNFDTGVVSLWVNPTSAASTSATDASGTVLPAALNYFFFHTQAATDGDKTIDDLTVATTFGEAVKIVGDANRDGLVDSIDFGFLVSNYGTLSGATWAMGDFDADGKVTSSDFNLLAGNFGPSAGPSLGTVVPEPGFAGVLLVGLLLKRSRKQG